MTTVTPYIIRKVLTPPQYHQPIPEPEFESSSSLSKFEERENPITPTNYSGATCCYNNLKLSPPFDSAMALTVLVLLTALFFMGFFSIYIRRFADESSVDPTRRRTRRRGDGGEELSTTVSYLSGSKAKGVDPTVVESLPVHGYNGGGAKQGSGSGDEVEYECAICLGEFEERECVKEIPYCGHVFHVECIDTWLSSHVTCPLCRTAKFFKVEEGENEVEGHVASGEEVEERELGVSEVHGDLESGDVSGGSGESEVRIVVDESDTWRIENGGERKSTCASSSSSWFGERLRLHRSLSF